MFTISLSTTNGTWMTEDATDNTPPPPAVIIKNSDECQNGVTIGNEIESLKKQDITVDAIGIDLKLVNSQFALVVVD